VPGGSGKLNREIHLQALSGPALLPGQAAFTNREDLTIAE